MPGGSKKGGGLEVKKSTSGAPYKMKGSPFQRNFGIGDSETPDAVTPDAVTPTKSFLENLGNVKFGKGNLRGAAQAALSQLPGGKMGSEEVEYERDPATGKLVIAADGKPIPIESKSETKRISVKDLFKDLRVGGGKTEEKEEVKSEDFEATEGDSPNDMKSPAKHPWPGADPSRLHGHEASDVIKENKEKQEEKEKKKKEKKEKKKNDK